MLHLARIKYRSVTMVLSIGLYGNSRRQGGVTEKRYKKRGPLSYVSKASRNWTG